MNCSRHFMSVRSDSRRRGRSPVSKLPRVPDKRALTPPPPSLDLFGSSPRMSHLQEAAKLSLNRMEVSRPSKWQNFREPLRLMLQVFQDVSDKNEDFWFPTVQYFVRAEYPTGSVLFRTGESAEGFYLIEKGIVRAEYDLPHGQSFHESIVAGTTCGELPFFSDTTRTATAFAEMGCVRLGPGPGVVEKAAEGGARGGARAAARVAKVDGRAHVDGAGYDNVDGGIEKRNKGRCCVFGHSAQTCYRASGVIKSW